MFEYTKEQLAAWKKKHGELFEIEVEGKKAILKKPSRKDLSYAFAASGSGKDAIKFNEAILNNCFVAGNEEIKTDDECFLAVMPHLESLVKIKEAHIKKL